MCYSIASIDKYVKPSSNVAPWNKKHFGIVTLVTVVSVASIFVANNVIFKNHSSAIFWIIPFLIWMVFNSKKGKFGKKYYGPVPWSVVIVGSALVIILVSSMK
ncbi:MAG: hypothetical protein ACREA5_06550 [Nitrosotalea sp.]